MRKFKLWLFMKFLPAWCREELLEENRRLALRVDELRAENARLNGYINGMHNALRLGRRIKIYTGEVRAGGPVERADGQ